MYQPIYFKACRLFGKNVAIFNPSSYFPVEKNRKCVIIYIYVYEQIFVNIIKL